MQNFLENIPYQNENLGKRKLVNEDSVLIMQIALQPGQSVGKHNANSTVHILVVKGEINITLNEQTTKGIEGSITPISKGTPMNIKNESGSNASFLVLKTPNPNL